MSPLLNYFSTGKRIQLVYFGSEHGKGEADGETGVISQCIDRHVSSGNVNIRNASDYFDICRSELTRTSESSPDSTMGIFRREFFLVAAADINHNRIETDVNTVPGTRKMHQVERVNDYVIKSRTLACFCPSCRRGDVHCVNAHMVGDWTTHKLKQRYV